jgi:hypothetical protein
MVLPRGKYAGIPVSYIETGDLRDLVRAFGRDPELRCAILKELDRRRVRTGRRLRAWA